MVGAYAFLILTEDKIYAALGARGIRPLSIGKLGDAYVISSETCAFDIVGATFVREINPGELVTISDEGIQSTRFTEPQKRALCSMEYVYLSRPDSDLNHVNVHASRKSMGIELAKEAPIEADVVTGVPDSSISAAIGYAEEMKLPYEIGIIKNRYIGRTFIQPTQELREQGVKMKLSPVRGIIEGKRVVMIDDSIVRGTTSRRIVKMLKDTGAKEVHVRIASPMITNPCYYGIDMSTRDELIAANHTLEEMRDMIGADSIAYLSPEGLERAIVRDDSLEQGLCKACMTGEYPVTLKDAGIKMNDQYGLGALSMSDAYKKAGEDVEKGDEAVERMKKHITRTKRKEVIGDVGAFAGLFSVGSCDYEEPVLVSGSDGVGTKLRLVQQLNKHVTIGIDVVAMCVNDIVAQGAAPLFFLDYIACGANDPVMIESIVSGVSEGCVQSGAALIGGETAEMPGMYDADEYDLAGFTVGIVDKKKIITGESIEAGDVLIGLSSSGIHSNGYSLVRQIVSELDLTHTYEGFTKPLGEALLEPTRIYAKLVQNILDIVDVKGISHITGGGFYENLPRMLPEGLGVQIDQTSWDVPEIFKL